MAVSRDGSTLLVSDHNGGSHAIHTFRVGDGSRLRVIGGWGNAPLQFEYPYQIWVASDDYVFVADYGNKRVQVLTPRLDFHGFVGAYQVEHPSGVCADGAVIVVCEAGAYRISVLKRCDGALLRRFGSMAAATVSCTPRAVCASCPGIVTSQSPTTTTTSGGRVRPPRGCRRAQPSLLRRVLCL